MLGINSCTYYIETLESSVGNNYLADFNYSKILVTVQDTIIVFSNAKYWNKIA